MATTMLPEIVYGPLKGDERHAYIRCPSCGATGWIDRDQYEGRVSFVCPAACGYHETHGFGAR